MLAFVDATVHQWLTPSQDRAAHSVPSCSLCRCHWTPMLETQKLGIFSNSLELLARKVVSFEDRWARFVRSFCGHHCKLTAMVFCLVLFFHSLFISALIATTIAMSPSNGEPGVVWVWCGMVWHGMVEVYGRGLRRMTGGRSAQGLSFNGVPNLSTGCVCVCRAVRGSATVFGPEYSRKWATARRHRRRNARAL